MPRHWDDDEDRDWEANADYEADPVESVHDDDEPTYPCPSCGAQVYELADACPYCGEYLGLDSVERAGGKPLWIWIGVIAAIAATGMFVVMMLLGLLSAK